MIPEPCACFTHGLSLSYILVHLFFRVDLTWKQKHRSFKSVSVSVKCYLLILLLCYILVKQLLRYILF
jgi:hypothetical protein